MIDCFFTFSGEISKINELKILARLALLNSTLAWMRQFPAKMDSDFFFCVEEMKFLYGVPAVARRRKRSFDPWE